MQDGGMEQKRFMTIFTHNTVKQEHMSQLYNTRLVFKKDNASLSLISTGVVLLLLLVVYLCLPCDWSTKPTSFLEEGLIGQVEQRDPAWLMHLKE